MCPLEHGQRCAPRSSMLPATLTRVSRLLSRLMRSLTLKKLTVPLNCVETNKAGERLCRQTIMSWLDKFANYCTSAHYQRMKAHRPVDGYKRRDNCADDDRSPTRSGVIVIVFLANREFEFEADDSF